NRVIPAVRAEREPYAGDRIEDQARSDCRKNAANENSANRTSRLQHAAVEQSQRDPEPDKHHKQSRVADEGLEQVEAACGGEPDCRTAGGADDWFACGSAETATNHQEEQRAVCQAVERPMMWQNIGPQLVANRADDGGAEC